jgi:hypothetical protein
MDETLINLSLVPTDLDGNPINLDELVPGDSFNLQFVVTDDSGRPLFSFYTDVEFDPNTLQVTDISYNEFLFSGALPYYQNLLTGTIDNSAGIVNEVGASSTQLAPLVAPGSSTVFTLTFEVIGSGPVTISTNPGEDSLSVTTIYGRDGDQRNRVDYESIDFTVASDNTAPISVNDNFNIAEDTVLTNSVASNDTDTEGDATYALETGPTNGAVTVNPDGTFVYTPDADFFGTDSFTYTLSDGEFSSTATVSVTIDPVNDAPVATDDSFTIAEDTVLTDIVAGNDTDTEGDATYALETGPANGSVTVNPDGTFSYTPDADFSGTDSFTYSLGDGEFSSTATVSVTIDPVNDAPVATDDSFTIAEDTVLTDIVAGNDTDTEGDATYALETGPANGSVTVNPDGTFSYTPDADFSGTDSFTYSLGDGEFSTEATVSVTIDPVNDAPVATDDSFTIAEDTVLTDSVAGNDTDTEGDATYALETGPANGSVTVNPDGTFSYTPDADFSGTDSFTYSLGDGEFSTEATVSVTIDPVNDAPVATDDSFTIAEDTVLSGSVAGNDTDTEGDATYALETGPANGSVTVNPDGTFTYTPDADFFGTDSFTYTLSDGEFSSTATASITVTDVVDNTAPVATNDSFTIAEDTVLSDSVAGNDTDTEGDATYALETGPANGSVTVNPDGTFTYTPDADFFGTDSFTYTLSDGEFSSTATASITVTDVVDNTAPVATNDSFTIAEDTVLSDSVAGNDTDTEGDATYALETGPANGSVTVNPDGTFTYTPDADFFGTDSFTYTLSDGEFSSTATASITVTDVVDNTAPVATNDSFTIAEDTVLSDSVAGNDTDTEGDATYALETGPANGSVTVNPDGTFTYTPDADFFGTDSFTYTLSDGEFSSTATASITVTDVVDNTAPVATNDSFTIAEDTVLGDSVAGNDTDTEGDATYALETGPANGSVTVNPDGTFTYTPDADFFGTDSFTYTLSDGEFSSTATASITVTDVVDNTAPVATNDSFTIAEDTVLGDSVAGNDTDTEGDATYALETGPANGSVTVNPDGTFTYTPDADFFGTDSFTYTLSDGEFSSTATASITVTDVVDNTAPVATNDSFTIAEDTVLGDSVAGNDTDTEGDATYALETGPANGSVTVNPDGTFTYTPDADFFGTDSFTYTLSDGEFSSTATASITITDVVDNTAPVATNDSFTIAEDTVLSDSVAGNDTDTEGDATYALETGPANGSVTVNPDGTFTYTPDADFFGTDSFTYTLSDGEFSSTATASITVTDVVDNTAPVATNDSFTIAEDTVLSDSVAGNDTDTEGDATYALETGPANGSVTVNPDGTFTYTPDADFFGTDSFTYTLSDGEFSSTATASITVTDVVDNTAPVATNDSFTIAEDTVLSDSVAGNDTDTEGDATYALETGPANGSVTVNPDGTFTYTPDADFFGTDSFTYTLSDGEFSSTATASITITDVVDNTAPVATNDSFTIAEDTVLSDSVAGNDTDIEGDATYALETGPANGSVTVNPDGTFTYTPDADFFGTDSFTYTLSDGEFSSTATASITITDVVDNTAPVATNDSFTIAEDTVLSDSVAGNDTDIEGDATYALETGPANGSVTVNPDGTFTYTPDADFFGTDSFTYTLSDGEFSSTATASITVDSFSNQNAPILLQNELSVIEGQPITLNSGNLLATDIDSDDFALTFFISNVQNGRFEIDGAETNSFTQADIFDGRVEFIPDGSELSPAYEVSVSDGALTTDPEAATVAFSTTQNDQIIFGTPGEDIIAPIGNESFTVVADDSDDVIITKGGDDIIVGGGGADIITTGSGNDIIRYSGPWYRERIDTVTDLELGTDKLDLAALFPSESHTSETPFSDYIRLIEDNGDTIVVGNFKGDAKPNFFRPLVKLEGVVGLGEGDFIFSSAGSNNPIDPGDQEDPNDPGIPDDEPLSFEINGNDFRNDLIAPDSNNYRLVGKGDNDTLIGNAGDDILIGGLGQDTLSGGDGSNRFVYESIDDGIDRISDFKVGDDILDFAPLFDANPIYGETLPQARFDNYLNVRVKGQRTIIQLDLAGDNGDNFQRFVLLENSAEVGFNDFNL